jgi:hypothetical protein
MTFRRSPIASSVGIAELNTTVNIVANGLDALPATRDLTKQQPSQVAQLSLSFAPVAASTWKSSWSPSSSRSRFRFEAARSLADLARDHIRSEPSCHMAIVVRDGNGPVLARGLQALRPPNSVFVIMCHAVA